MTDGAGLPENEEVTRAVVPGVIPAQAAPPEVETSGALDVWGPPGDTPPAAGVPGDAPARRRERWAWPAVAVVAALAGLAYGWAAGHTSIEIYYAAAVRTMSRSWHSFLFGGFDPAGTVTLDKLPGSFWVQALVVRAFGLSTWTLVGPQVVAGVATVVVLFVAVRRVAGARAGLVAAVIAAATPAAAVMSRGNTADGLCVLLMVLAADATMRAVRTGRIRPLVVAAILVGLGFQAKMLEAWAILPALGGAYLLAAPGRARVRFGRLAVAGAVTVVVSLAWMTAVSLVPASQRPYVDGTAHNSVFEQVFVYNGVGRFGHGTALGLPRPAYRPTEHALEYGAEVARQLRPNADNTSPGVARLVAGPVGRNAGWLLLVALVASGALIFSRRGRPRTDAIRAAAVLWAGWLITFAVLDSAGTQLLSYYTGVFTPPVAVLCALGLRAAYRAARARADDPAIPANGPAPEAGRTAVKVLPALVVGALTSVILVRGTPAWFTALTLGAILVGLAVAIAALAALGIDARRRAAGLVAAFATLLVGPVAATVTLVAAGGGSFDAPYTRDGTLAHSTARVTVRGYGAVVLPSMTDQVWSELRSMQGQYASHFGPGRVFLVFSSAEAAELVLGGVSNVVPIGGFTGLVAAPTLDQLSNDLRAGRIMYAVVPGGGDPRAADPRVQLIEDRCRSSLANRDRDTAAPQIYVCPS